MRRHITLSALLASLALVALAPGCGTSEDLGPNLCDGRTCEGVAEPAGGAERTLAAIGLDADTAGDPRAEAPSRKTTLAESDPADFYGTFIVDPKPTADADELVFPTNRTVTFGLEGDNEAITSLMLHADGTFDLSYAECADAFCARTIWIPGEFTVVGDTIDLDGIATGRLVTIDEREALSFTFDADILSPGLRGARYVLVAQD